MKNGNVSYAKLSRMLLDKGYESEVADCICRMLMDKYGTGDWDEEAPRVAQLVIEYAPIKGEKTCLTQ